MKEYIINYELSKKIFEENKGLIKRNECYKNVFNIFLYNILEDKNPKYCVGYAIKGDFVYRHGFIRIEDKIIDPTPFSYSNEKEVNDLKYMIFSEYSGKEYRDLFLTEKSKFYGLEDSIAEEEVKFIEENNLFEKINMIDITNLIRNYYVSILKKLGCDGYMELTRKILTTKKFIDIEVVKGELENGEFI